ncbi:MULTISPECIES: HypC/HybG/HupF family hydrogenase formation chaperone [Acidianus]|uniref:Hydrogenase assembly protein HypC n=1 Tax=Candidatus Acidianus copahuensis TaxID=1160895 RepID=A0A031LL75_9CREN|nr:MULTISPECIES: HypC/HybG/HupF family hydrogenase formation chaperone [Acidianus]EZQ01979.1 hydrogenase assembly protein HypC [Candidatus Acidianus copahuensis]NON62676.1 HypC/HybG/HupF family hydrogenase formation chaperone [Acidianus sp. RZ1]
MCVAFPGRVLEIYGDFGKVDFGNGTIKDNVLLSLVNVNVGDYVLVHAGYAIQVIDEVEARRTIEMWEEMNNGISNEKRKQDFYEAIGGKL